MAPTLRRFCGIQEHKKQHGILSKPTFFLGNVKNPKLPELNGELETEAMVKARDKTRSDMVKKDDRAKVLFQLSPGDLVRGQNPKTRLWNAQSTEGD